MYVDEIRVQPAENRPQKQVQERLREYMFISLILPARHGRATIFVRLSDGFLPHPFPAENEFPYGTDRSRFIQSEKSMQSRKEQYATIPRSHSPAKT